MRTLMKTINFGKNLRLSEIQPIKTAEIKSIQFEKKKGKTLHPVCHNDIVIVKNVWFSKKYKVSEPLFSLAVIEFTNFEILNCYVLFT
jgi:hypothetical protein